MKRNTKIYYAIISTFLPTLTSAQSFSLGGAGTNFKTVVDEVTSIVWIVIPMLSTAAFLVFFWGLSKFILNSNKPEEIANGKKYMIWGTLALFILLSWRAIVGLVSNDLEIGSSVPNENTILLPVH